MDSMIRESNPCSNLKQLINSADNKESLSTLEEISACMETTGSFLPGEYEALTELIGKKRLELAGAYREPTLEKAPGLYIFYPEMGESRPACQIVAQRSYYGKHFRISTPLFLKGRGITYDGIKMAKDLTDSRLSMAGWNEYTVTERAFEMLQEKYSISQEALLD